MTLAAFCVKQFFWEHRQFLDGCWLTHLDGRLPARKPLRLSMLYLKILPHSSHLNASHSVCSQNATAISFIIGCTRPLPSRRSRMMDGNYRDIYLLAQPARNKPSRTLWLASLLLNTNKPDKPTCVDCQSVLLFIFISRVPRERRLVAV